MASESAENWDALIEAGDLESEDPDYVLAYLLAGRDTLPDHERRLDAAVEAAGHAFLGGLSVRDRAEFICRTYVGWRP